MTAAMDVLADIEARRRPAKLALKDWGAAHRFAGAKDRAWISGLVLDALRRKRSLAWGMDGAQARALVLGALRWSWGWSVDHLSAACAAAPHGPGALGDQERRRLSAPLDLEAAPDADRADCPDWACGELAGAFGERWVEETAQLTARAPVDLRVNTLKSDPDRSVQALHAFAPQRSEILVNGVRVPAPEPGVRAAHVEAAPAFLKGWVEVQDFGSQIAAAAAGQGRGAQILDYCAGGGGKTLALAAQMAGSGQVYAYDADARRLAPSFDRIRRAGARNVQIRSPAGAADAPLADLIGKMDVVFVDAPCTGSGVWRRHPDAKWRLRPAQLERRTAEQDAILNDAAAYVKPGGRLVYVTCSVFAAENETRIAAFLARRSDFSSASALAAVCASEQVTDAGAALLAQRAGVGDALRLSPLRTRTEGFFLAVAQRG